MQVLGLDFATKTGVAKGYAGAPAARVECCTWELPGGGGADVGEFFFVFRRLLDDTLMRGVDLVVFEAPFLQHRAAPNQTRRAYGFAAIIEECCYARGIRCLEVAVPTLKKSFAGHGRAQKHDMIAAARRRGFIVANDHEADASACFLHGVEAVRPDALHLYDPIFTASAQ